MRRNNTIKGFTIVELLIVIVVIAILAAITVIAYNGVVRQVVESSMKSDLRSLAKLAETKSTQTGALPASYSDLGFPDSSENDTWYELRPYGYCVSVWSDRIEMEYSIRSNNGAIEEGGCDLTISNYAGSGTSGFQNGTAATARFSDVSGIVMDSQGNMFVADDWNHRIRKITPDGTVSTFAGSGVNSNTTGTGTAASIDRPQGLLIDANDNLYTSSGLYKIKITPAGVVSHLTTNANGVAGAIDAQGSLYVYDFTNHVIRKVTSTGTVSVFAGQSGSPGHVNATGSAARFNNPTSLAIGSNGDVYVADRGNNRIRKISPTGVVSHYAGSGAGGIAIVDGPQATATIGELRHITMDSTGTLWILSKNDITRLRAVLPDMNVVTVGGVNEDGDEVGWFSIAEPTALYSSRTGDALYSAGVDHQIKKIKL